MRRVVSLAVCLASLPSGAAGAQAAADEAASAPTAGRAPDYDEPRGAQHVLLHRLHEEVGPHHARGADTPAAGGPGGREVLARDRAARTTTAAGPPAPLGSFGAGTLALDPGPDSLCGLAPPAW